ncbi:MAG: hypothetical protein RR495_07405 [Anaerovoracaceae bacterium]
MKKILAVALSVIMVLAITGCDRNKNEEVKLPANRLTTQEGIGPYTLNNDEKVLLEAFGTPFEGNIYSYFGGDKAKIMVVRLSELDKNLKWQEISSSTISKSKDSDDKNFYGLLGINATEDGRIAVSVRDHGGTYTLNMKDADGENEGQGTKSEIGLQEFKPLALNKQIPIKIFVTKKEGDLAIPYLNSYNNTQKLKGMDRVLAITVEFNEEYMSEI